MKHKELFDYILESFDLELIEETLDAIVKIVEREKKKRYDIDFAGNVLAGIKVSGDIEIVGAMDGWGNEVSLENIKITEIDED